MGKPLTWQGRIQLTLENDKKEGQQKLSLKRQRLGNIEGREIEGPLSKEHLGTESQQVAFSKTGLKKENYEKWRKN